MGRIITGKIGHWTLGIINESQLALTQRRMLQQSFDLTNFCQVEHICSIIRCTQKLPDLMHQGDRSSSMFELFSLFIHQP